MSEKKDATLATLDRNANSLDLGRLYGAILDDRLMVAITVAIMMVFGVIFYFFATPIYSTDAMVQVETSASNSILNDVSKYLPSATPKSDAQIKVIKSTLVQFKTIQDLHLDIEHQQHYFPIFGKGWARMTHQPASTLDVNKLEVPRDLLERYMTLTVTGPNTFSLSSDSKILLQGTAGQPRTATASP